MSKIYTIKPEETLDQKFDFVNHATGIMLVKDANSTYQKLSDEAGVVLGWKDGKSAIGANDYNIPSRAVEMADLFINIDRQAVADRNKIDTIENFVTKDEIVNLFVQKSPIYADSGEALGIIVHAIDVTKFVEGKYHYLKQRDKKFIPEGYSPKQYILDANTPPLPITERQEDCLSLIIRGKTMKEIGIVLGISQRTVETHVETMKYKLGCSNRAQLIEKAINSGFLFHISSSFLGLPF